MSLVVAKETHVLAWSGTPHLPLPPPMRSALTRPCPLQSSASTYARPTRSASASRRSSIASSGWSGARSSLLISKALLRLQLPWPGAPLLILAPGWLYSASSTAGLLIKLRSLCRGFAQLQPVPRKRLIDSLVSNLSVLNACVDSAANSDAETLLRHRTALKLYVFFLHWVLEQAETEARQAGAAAAQPPPAAKCVQQSCRNVLSAAGRHFRAALPFLAGCYLRHLRAV